MAEPHLRNLLQSILDVLDLEAHAAQSSSLIPESVSLLPREQLVIPTMMSAEIIKADSERQMVFGFANIAVEKDGEQIVDAHDEMIDLEDLELAAYDHVLKFRASGVQHQGDAIGHLVESFVITPDKLEALGLAKDALPGAWWVGYYIPDAEIFAQVKEGAFTDFSIQGMAEREDVDG